MLVFSGSMGGRSRGWGEKNGKNPACFFLCATKVVLWKGFTLAEVCLWNMCLWNHSSVRACGNPVCLSPVSGHAAWSGFVNLVTVFVLHGPLQYTASTSFLLWTARGRGLERCMPSLDRWRNRPVRCHSDAGEHPRFQWALW